MITYDKKAAGERIRTRRHLLGITQEELALKVGRAPKYCQDIERGTCGMSIETLLSFAACLNTSLDFIIYGSSDTQEEEKPLLIQEQEAVLELLGQCSDKKRKYALELLKLFMKACDLQ